MRHSEIFGDSKWICAANDEICPIISKSFAISGVKRANINILGFASFVLYINGVRASDDYFLPLASDYEERNSPEGEILGHRAYVSNYDITHLLRNGQNTVSVLLGNGWYTGDTGIYREVPYGKKKLCFAIDIECENENIRVISDEDCIFCDSFIKKCDLNFGEEHDYSNFDLEIFCSPRGESVTLAPAPNTEYYYTDCPTDKLIKEIIPTVAFRNDDYVIYDVGANITGFPLVSSVGSSDVIKVTFSEDLSGCEPHPRHSHKQEIIFRTGGKKLLLESVFTWFGFRYFKVEGAANVISVKRIHAAVSVNSNFECDSDTLNWLYHAYVNTQLCNMHQGIPSDCPHIERRGYTGDGQLTAKAAMLTLDSESFYRKWIADIADCQDRKSGHVQYTAPYTHSGGGPGGWGSAIVKVPYEFLCRFGDASAVKELYRGMLSYIEYLDQHSEFGLVTSDREGEWCLGEWCVPANHPGNTALPPQFVNTYFYVKACEMLLRIAKMLGDLPNVSDMQSRIEYRKSAIKAAYYNQNNGDFLGNTNGANAFMLDIGLGDERTRERFIKHYEDNGYYDTGIFGTDIVTRLLFEYGRADIAIKLMTADTPHGFGKWMRSGATSLWEYWNNPRSMSHPMFGAVTAYLFEYVLGIRQEADTYGYKSIIISPAMNTPLGFASGYVSCKYGRIEVSYKKDGESVKISVRIPSGCSAKIISAKKEIPISNTEIFEISLPISDFTRK